MDTNYEPLTLLSLRQIAERTGASQSFWRRECRLKRIRVFRLGDLIRIAEPDLAAWLAQHAQPAEARR